MTIEQYLIEYLNDVLDVPVYAEEPHSSDAEYVVIQKTGSSTENYIVSCTIAIQSYSINSKLNAAELNELVKKAMDDLVENDEISKSRLNNDYDYTDTSTKKWRYQAVYDLVVLF